jgi:diguanylate cyclase (GGDEF)-like protein/PAS domain S-box-containing protein
MNPRAGKADMETPERTRFSRLRSPIDDYPGLILDAHVALLRGTIWVVLIGSALFMASLLVMTGEYAPRIYSVIGLIVLAAASLVVLRWRGSVAAVRLLILGAWVIATYAGFIAEGVRTPILIAYPIMLVFSGWMLGARYCIGLFIVSCVAVIFLAIGQHAGALGIAAQVPPGIVAVAYLVVLSISAMMTLYLLRLFGERYAEERRLNGEVRLHLQAAEKRESDLRLVAEHIPCLVFEGDREGRCLFANRGFEKFFAIPIDGAPGLHISKLIELDAAGGFAPYQEAVLRGEVVEFLARKRSAEGVWRNFDVTLVPRHAAEGECVVGWYGLMYDVTRREQAVSELRDRAMHDALTGLANRLFLDDRLAHMVERAARTQTSAAVMVIDLDHFKEVNDTLGHGAGDQLLCQVAKRLEASVRSADTVARCGGDEFVVVIEGVKSLESAEAVAAKILAELALPFMIGAEAARIGGSIGVAVYPDAGRTAEELLRVADLAMYEAKTAGRNCYRIVREDQGKA